ERRAVLELVGRLAGHPLGIRLAGEAVYGYPRAGAVADHVPALGPLTPDALRRLVPDMVGLLGETGRQVLAVSVLLASAPIAPDLIASVLSGALARSGVPEAQVVGLIGGAVNELASHQLAERGAAGWLVHPLVVDAVRAVCPVDERL